MHIPYLSLNFQCLVSLVGVVLEFFILICMINNTADKEAITYFIFLYMYMHT